MAKKQDFASKVAKAQKGGDSCPVCGDVYQYLMKEKAYYSESNESWKYKKMNLKICKCNEKEAYA
jgi:hypothetical protein